MKRLIVPLIALFALAAAATAVGAVVVYKNDFKKRGDFQQVRKLEGGKPCGKAWRGKKSLGAIVKEGPKNCALRTPVGGDRKQPDHTIKVVGKVVKKKTHRKVRRSTYLGVALRANRKSHYELRVFPKGGRWRLNKNGDKIAGGTEKAIKGIDSNNKLRLVAEGSRVLAKVNGTKLRRFKDSSPEEVSGRKTVLTYGNSQRSRKDGFVVFDKLRVLVPNP